MAKRKAARKTTAKMTTAQIQTQAVRAAWHRVRQSLTKAETAMLGVVDANRGLMKALGKAGVSMTKSARKDLDARVRKLDISRQNARKQLDALTKRLMALAKRAKTKAKRR